MEQQLVIEGEGFMRPTCAVRTPRGRWPRSRASLSQRGQAMVEFALVLPLLAMLMAGIVEVGDALFDFSTLTTASRDGARLGMKTTDNAAVQNAVLLNLRQPNDSTATGTVTVTRSVVNSQNRVQVRACQNHALLINYPLLPLPNPIAMCATTTMRAPL